MSIQSEIDRINNAKAEIAEAISEKGVAVAEGTSIEDLPELVRSIPQEGGSDNDVILWVTCETDPTTMTLKNFSHSYDEIVQAVTSNKAVKIKSNYENAPNEFSIGDLTYYSGYSGYVLFTSLVRNGNMLVFMNVKMYSNETIESGAYIIEITPLS